METTAIGNKLATPPLSGEQISITQIPRELYAHFYLQKVGNAQREETVGEVKTWFELPTDTGGKAEKVIAVLVERSSGDAVETKFALLPWYPRSEEYFWESYDFEIFAKLQSRGWTLGEGNRFTETLSYQTRTGAPISLVANHPMTDYIALALTEMRRLLKEKAHLIVRQEFVDNAPRPPR